MTKLSETNFLQVTDMYMYVLNVLHVIQCDIFQELLICNYVFKFQRYIKHSLQSKLILLGTCMLKLLVSIAMKIVFKKVIFPIKISMVFFFFWQDKLLLFIL